MSIKHKNYYTSLEAAEKLGVAVSTIQTWTDSGLLNAWTTGGGHRRIAVSSVEDMLSKQQANLSEKKYEKQPSVVIVEDDLQQLRLYEEQFKSWRLNVNIVKATDGYEGLIKIGRTLPDIIISDLKMPRMDGSEMIRALKGFPELVHSLVVVVTGLTKDEIKARGGLPENVHLFIKPVDFVRLERLVYQKISEGCHDRREEAE